MDIRLLENDGDNVEGADQKSDDEKSISSSSDEFASLNPAFSESLPEDFSPDIGTISPVSTDVGDGSPQTHRGRSWISASASNIGRTAKAVGLLKVSGGNMKPTQPSLKVDGTL